jgi:dTDP-glucose 4,6-dehydratase/UDP-glucose 4-epimerase
VDEKHPIRPVDVNGINKLAGEGYHLLYSQVHGIRSSILRLTNTYGPGMRVKDARQTFLGIWVRQLIEGSTIKVFGDGSQLRDFNYVDDCVDALLLAATADKAVGRVYNLGSREVIALKDLALLMTELVPGGRFEVVPFPPERKAIDIGDYYSDFSLMHAELGWSPKLDLREGLQRTIDYYKANGPHYWDATHDPDERLKGRAARAALGDGGRREPCVRVRLVRARHGTADVRAALGRGLRHVPLSRRRQRHGCHRTGAAGSRHRPGRRGRHDADDRLSRRYSRSCAPVPSRCWPTSSPTAVCSRRSVRRCLSSRTRAVLAGAPVRSDARHAGVGGPLPGGRRAPDRGLRAVPPRALGRSGRR